jgi:hypothetical protein
VIVKIIRQPTVANAIRYASRRGKAECVGGCFPMEMPGGDLLDRYMEVLSLRPDLTNQVLHLPVRLTEQDRELTPEEWGQTARSIIEAHHLQDTPWMAWIHRDKEPPAHLHIVSLNTSFGGERVDLGGDFKTNKRIGEKLELEYGLWRAPRIKGGQVLPPVGVTPPDGLPSLGKTARARALIEATIRKGMPLSTLSVELAKKGVELVPAWTQDGLRIKTLGFRFEGTWEPATTVDKRFSLRGLQELGISYNPARDVPLLAPPAPALVAARIEPLVPKHQVERVAASAAPQPHNQVPVPTVIPQPPSRRIEVPHVPAQSPSQTFFRRSRDLALGLWARVRRISLPEHSAAKPRIARP